jgi:hypothetical protein
MYTIFEVRKFKHRLLRLKYGVCRVLFAQKGRGWEAANQTATCRIFGGTAVGDTMRHESSHLSVSIKAFLNQIFSAVQKATSVARH